PAPATDGPFQRHQREEQGGDDDDDLASGHGRHCLQAEACRPGRATLSSQACVAQPSYCGPSRCVRLLKVCIISRFGLMLNSVTALLRRRMFSAIVTSAGVDSTSPTAVEMGPPLDTSSTLCPAWRWRTCSSAS